MYLYKVADRQPLGYKIIKENDKLKKTVSSLNRKINELKTSANMFEQQAETNAQKYSRAKKGAYAASRKVRELQEESGHYRQQAETNAQKYSRAKKGAYAAAKKARELQESLGKYKIALPAVALATLGLGAGGGYYVGSRNNQQ